MAYRLLAARPHLDILYILLKYLVLVFRSLAEFVRSIYSYIYSLK